MVTDFWREPQRKCWTRSRTELTAVSVAAGPQLVSPDAKPRSEAVSPVELGFRATLVEATCSAKAGGRSISGDAPAASPVTKIVPEMNHVPDRLLKSVNTSESTVLIQLKAKLGLTRFMGCQDHRKLAGNQEWTSDGRT